jgi:hypothetical protein
MAMEKRKERKQRSDKKHSINPTITLSLYDQLIRLSYICNRPLKDIGETLCIYGLYSPDVISEISPRFHRDFWLDECMMFRGNPKLPVPKEVVGQDQYRASLKFLKGDYEQISKLAYAMNISKSKATANLLEISLQNKPVLGKLLSRYVESDLDTRRMKQLRLVLRYANPDHLEDEMTMSNLLSFLFEHFGDKAKRMTEAVVDWMESLK